MLWLITGGCGFIGRNLVAKLLASGAGHRIRVLDDLSVGTEAGLAQVAPFERVPRAEVGSGSSAVELVVGDIRDYDTVEAAAKGVDAVVHLAACTGVIPSLEDPFADCRTNVLGTLNCLQAARVAGARRFVFASSGAPLGEQEPPLTEDLAPRPLSPYGASKLAGEGYCTAFHGSFGLGTMALRFSNVYGPLSGAKESVVAKFIKRALSGQKLEVFGDGSQTRDYIYVEDLVECIITSAQADVGGEVVQVATGLETPLLELLTALQRFLEPHVGGAVEVVHRPRRAGEVQRSYADISKVGRLLGWHPRWTLESGLPVTIDWFVAQHDKRDG